MVYFDRYRFCSRNKELYRGSERVDAPLRALLVLDLLLSKAGRLTTKQELFHTAWAGTHVTESSLTEAVHQLRQVLRDSAREPRFVETVKGRGYRFVGTVREPLERRLRRALGAVAALSQSGSMRLVAGGCAAALLALAIWPTPEPRPSNTLARVSPAGSVLETVELPPMRIEELSPSPDGTRLALGVKSSTRQEIWIFDHDGSNLQRVSEGGDNFHPVWAPDGSQLAWANVRGGNADIVRKDLTRGNLETLVGGPGGQYPEDWANDGDLLVFSDSRGGRLELRAKTLSEGRTFTFTGGSTDEYLASLSPDGRWLAYTSDRSGRWEVYARAVDSRSAEGPSRAGRQISRSGGGSPFWSHDGEALYYLEDKRLLRARLDREADGRPVIEEVLEGVDWAGTQPDGLLIVHGSCCAETTSSS